MGVSIGLKPIFLVSIGEECLKTNYYGAKRMIEALIPLLQLSDSPKIINLSSRAGQLQVQK